MPGQNSKFINGCVAVLVLIESNDFAFKQNQPGIVTDHQIVAGLSVDPVRASAADYQIRTVSGPDFIRLGQGGGVGMIGGDQFVDNIAVNPADAIITHDSPPTT